jgi:hypothetical protein
MLTGNIANNTTGSQQPAVVSASNSASATPESGTLIAGLPAPRRAPMLLSAELAYKVNNMANSTPSELPEHVNRDNQADSERTDIGRPRAMSNESPSTTSSTEAFTPEQIAARYPGVQLDPKWLAVAEGDSMHLNALYAAMSGPEVPLKKGNWPPSIVEELSRLVPYRMTTMSSC